MRKTTIVDNPWTSQNFETEMELIGEGSFGKVYKTESKKDRSKPIAIKLTD